MPVLAEVPAERRELAARVRELVEEIVHTDAPAADLLTAAEWIAGATALLRTARRDRPMLLAHDGGYQVSMHSPVEGPGNPLAPPMTGLVAADGEMRATAVLSGAYEGPPGRVHGGWVAALLDHAVGRAVACAGLPAMTVSLTVDYRRGTPYGVPLTVRARFTGSEGRRVFATGEIVADGEVTAEASAILVAIRGLPASTQDG
ncbi:aromatic compound degradation protein PaaI [Gandjariella thermophila]|uniref:Acyl-coenzyme A thioesterase THEM4 n=1 Tax=Gandjariella thermophila TaxID=1931992 RepID=A0A4D4J5K9_9PSEU|nr:aromatic compound degradation protein PaaI [Gandjariella thermophila]